MLNLYYIELIRMEKLTLGTWSPLGDLFSMDPASVQKQERTHTHKGDSKLGLIDDFI